MASAHVAQQEAQKSRQGRELADPEEKVPFQDIEPEVRYSLHHFDSELGNLFFQPMLEALFSLSDGAVRTFCRHPMSISEHHHKSIRTGSPQSFADRCGYSQGIHTHSYSAM